MAWSAAALLAGCGGHDGGATQVAAKVNGQELTVHQINFVLQQNPQMAAAVGSEAPRQVLERLIDQELTLQQAQAQKLDRDPNVVAAIEAAKRDILSRAYMDRQLERVPAPAPQEVKAYFESKPELFAQRQIYTLTEVQLDVPPEAVAGLRSMLQSGQTAESLAQWAGSKQYRVQVNHLVRPAEGLPLTMLPQLASAADGQGVMQMDGSVAQVFFVESRRAEPVTLEQARTAIQAAITNERRRQAALDELKRLRAAAKVEYVGLFAASAPQGTTGPHDTPPATMPAEAAGSEASAGLDDATLKKGLGLK